MVKQGQFAQVSAFKKARQFQQRKQAQQSQTIKADQVTDFILVRYHLTQGSKQPDVVRESLQRFLMVWLDNAPQVALWSVATMTTATVQQIGTQVPWQFYAIITNEWPKLLKFLQKELPAVPLADRIRLTDELASISDLVAQQLAVNWFVATYAGDPDRLARVTESQVSAMQTSFVQDGQLNWSNIKTVYMTAPFAPADDIDEGTAQWFAQLTAIEI